MLGGSSSINGMVYVRGQPQDYDHWASLGLTDWGWRKLADYFKRMEDHVLGADDLRGDGGPLGIVSQLRPYPLADAVLEAPRLGVPVKDDLNRPDQEGIGYLSRTIKAGRRQSSAEAFLKPARGRPNLRVVTDTVVQRVLFDGTRAVGCRGPWRQAPRVPGAREVILSAGALQSPKLLQLSGMVRRAPATRDRRSRGQPRRRQNIREHRLLFIQHRVKSAAVSTVNLPGCRLCCTRCATCCRAAGQWPRARTTSVVSWHPPRSIARTPSS